MLQFANPVLLAVAAAVVVVGIAVIVRSRARPRQVPSVKLWAGLGEVQGRRGRGFDPLWILVLLGGVVAGVCMAGPQWRPVVTPEAGVEWSVRTLNGSGGTVHEGWVRWAGAADGDYAVRVEGQERKASGSELRAGVVMALRGGGPVALQVREGERVIGEAAFQPPRGEAFGLLAVTGRGREVDPAMMRVFSIMPGAVRGDPTLAHSVVLVNDPLLPETDAALQQATLVVAEADTPLPGIALGEEMVASGEGWRPRSVALPAFVQLEDVRVDRFRRATLSGEWEILATVEGHPFLARRRHGDGGGAGRTWIWVAASPATGSNWPALPSFVLYFANLAGNSGIMGTEGAREWERVSAGGIVERNSVGLASYGGVFAIIMLTIAVGWFVHRSR